ncbi:beta-ketoacyl-[acyl-carrier-protein] synthase family protein [Desulfovibrio sp. Huiquan2017]|uniref:beta-ketoacyl-[acyl-carrier-protein] synthase family protein n=1 Tax=Desulfovibrio sp. Huiquan2017 TaxID=2816861 RepID=UPI00336A5DEF
MRRVVITGMGAVSPFGTGVESLMRGLAAGESGVRPMAALREISGLVPTIAGTVPDCDEKSIPRKFRRSMSPMSIYAALAAREAVAMAGLDEAMLTDAGTGLCLGSTVGSVQAMQAFFARYLDGLSIEGTKATEFFKIMNHSCATNLAQFFGITGRVVAPSAACSTGCQSIGLAAEAVAIGRQEVMLCGGADELHPLTVGTFDVIEAASTGYNEVPEQTPRPFDRDRDGIVCAEGAGLLVLESLDHALARNATILAEILGFASTSDPSNLASPSDEAIARCMSRALDDAGVSPAEVDYVNAHATGTRLGDAAESAAIASLLGAGPKVSSLKGHLGHTMAASGGVETIATISMMNNGLVFPTRNLIDIAPDCVGLSHVLETEKWPITTALKNSFALGGINTSIVLRRYDD